MVAAIDTGQAWSDVQDWVGDHVAISAGIGVVFLFLVLALIVATFRARGSAELGRVRRMTRRQRRQLRGSRRRQEAEERKRRQEERRRDWEAEKLRRKAVRKGQPDPVSQPTQASAPPPFEPPSAEPSEPPVSARRDRLMDVALERLHQVEAQAEQAERREQEATRLAKLQSEESERDLHLRELSERVREAEAQAKEAEERARAAEVAAQRSAKAVDVAASANDELAATVGAEEGKVADAVRKQEEGLSVPGWVSQQLTNLNKATFDQLRELGMSVTQATRVLSQREKSGGFDSVDALDTITGMPRKLLDEIKKRLTI